MEKKDIIFIGGGNTFLNKEQAIEYFKKIDIDLVWNDKSWREWLAWSLEDKYNFIFPKMPAKENSDYDLWKIVFEKYLSKVGSDKPIIIGYSLGTIFIIKYLIENGFLKKIKALHLVAPIISNSFQSENDTENTGSFTFETEKISLLKNICEEIYIWHSLDDKICDFKNAEFIKKEIPESELHTFLDRGHFFQTTFLELFDVLRK